MEDSKNKTANQFGINMEATLAWVKKKHPQMTPEEQTMFATNIIEKRRQQTSPERYRLSFWSWSGGYRRHDDMSKNDAKYYYLKYCRFGEVDLQYCPNINEDPEPIWMDYNPDALFE